MKIMGTSKIKCIAFDLGGVVIHLSYEQAVRRFEESQRETTAESPQKSLI